MILLNARCLPVRARACFAMFGSPGSTANFDIHSNHRLTHISLTTTTRVVQEKENRKKELQALSLSPKL